GGQNLFLLLGNQDKNGFIWVTTAAGMSKIDPVSGTVTEYAVEDGLTEGFYMDSAANSSDGLLYFGSSSGITAVNPAIHSSASRPPQLSITDIRVLNRSLGAGALPEGVKLDGTLPRPLALTVPWSYWLEGFDKQPVQADASRPVATYTNLAPGKYHFHLQGTNNKGVAARDEIILPITITPPPWQTGWARAVQAALVLLAAAILARWLMRRWRARAQELETLLAERSEALRQAEHKLAYLSASDKLTGLANRRSFDDQLAGEWRRAAREEKSLAMGLLALDQMDLYSELHGQAEADALLRRVAHTLQRCMHRAGDALARYGAEQFAVLAPGVSQEEVALLANQIRACMEAAELPRSGPGSLRIGVAALLASPYEAASVLQQQAEEALYQAAARPEELSEIHG
ncbi:MAG: diguanylate cyclase, partial [Rhodospirillaceae bacterium]|nr:diguanylate cyclase [Rhodospirillaceae bacterium]